MNQPHPVSAALLCCALVITFDGCIRSNSQQFRTSFLPPAPKTIAEPEVELVSDQAPAASKEFIKELPNMLPLEPAMARGSEIDNRLRRAEDKFEAGREAYQQGKLAEARRAFDQGIDILLAAPEGAPDRAKLERRLDQMVETIYRYDVNGLGAAEDAGKVVFDKSPLDGILEMTFPIDPRLKPQVKEEIRATTSQLPLDESDSVLGYIHFFSSPGGRRVLTSGLRRAGRYRPMIQKVLDEEGVPQELIYLAQAESGFLPRAVSYKQAAGMWQFLAWRGAEYGLQITKLSDERLDPEKATRAAARHLRDLYQQFGDWYLAMAAYNCGPGCVDRAVRRTGYADFWSLSNLSALPKQTQKYVPAILAITIMAKNPEDYGLTNLETDGALEYDSLKLEAPTSLALVADALERPISEILELNPALLKGIAPSTYELRIPKGSAHTLLAALDAVPASRRASWRMHRIEKGESLAVIARRYSTPVSAIASVNNSYAAAPEAGDMLLIPAAYHNESGTARHAVKSVRRSVRTASPALDSRRTASRQHMNAVLHHRAAPARIRTASLGSGSGQ